jgi:hypothetical protein
MRLVPATPEGDCRPQALRVTQSRHRIGKRAMTGAERVARFRAKQRRARIWGANSDPSARRPTPKRTDQDFWPTPPELQVALVRSVLPLLPPGPANQIGGAA